jgi:hypothetical protein
MSTQDAQCCLKNIFLRTIFSPWFLYIIFEIIKLMVRF